MKLKARVAALVGLVLLASLGCADAEDGVAPPSDPELEALFAPAMAAEVAAAEADWADRDVAVQNAVIELDTVLTTGGPTSRVRVLSHTLDGIRHFGAVVTPVGALPGSVPTVVYAHGGDQGASVEEVLLLAAVLEGQGYTAGFVAPSFRDEDLSVGAREFQSDGPASPWNRDVDDAIALLTTALDNAPELDAGRIGVVGFSRGGGVGLLMGARDPRIDAVVEFFGPTDFFGTFVRDVVEEALAGNLRDLPGLDYLNETVIQPWAAGTLSTTEARAQMVLRSPVLFVDRMPAVQLHHGTSDPIVDVSQAESLIAAMTAAGRGEPEFEAFLYPGGGHNPLTLPGAIERAASFLSQALAPPAAVAESRP